MGVSQPGLARVAVASELVPFLWQGKRPRSFVGFEMVVCCEDREPLRRGYDGVVVHVPMRDDSWFDVDGVAVERAAGMVSAMVERSRPVLVYCAGGLNRSSIVSVRALQLVLGCGAGEAISLVRRLRSDLCLSNAGFERWLLA